MKSQPFIVYLDGKYLECSSRQLRSLTPGILKGQGVFETLLCEQRKIYFLSEHLRRMRRGLKFYGLSFRPALRSCLTIGRTLLKINGLTGGRFRICVWRKENIEHVVFIILPRQGFAASIYQHGFTAVLYPKAVARSREKFMVKDLDYQFCLKAYEWALRRGAQEALWLNPDGEVAEGSRSNLFIVKDRVLYTPSTLSGCLAGVTRQAIIHLAKEWHWQCQSAGVTPKAIAEADEAFLTNALIGVMPLVRVNGQNIGSGRPGPVTREVMKSYKKLSRAKAVFVV